MTKEQANPPRMIAYLSLAKLEQVYGQLNEFDVQKVKQASDSKVKGGVTAKIASVFGLLSGGADLSAQRQMVSTKEGQMNSLINCAMSSHIIEIEARLQISMIVLNQKRPRRGPFYIGMWERSLLS